MNYEQTMAYFDELQLFGVHLGLKNITYLLQLLDNPHQKFNSIHITGSNGKGSTATFVASILSKGSNIGNTSIKVGLYTSPHLLSFTERIVINNIPISEEKVAEIMSLIVPILEKNWTTKQNHPTYFEVATALAFYYFAQEKIDIAVLEVGLGGRLDATNVVTPLVSCITNIELEHVGVLGETLTDIAYEKAGIIKQGIPVVTASTQKEALDVIEMICKQKNCPLYCVEEDKDSISDIRFKIEALNKFTVSGLHNIYPNLQTKLLGYHQMINASTAIGIVELIESVNISIDSIRKGLAEAKWQGRMEIISENPLIVLDGAHNPAGAMALRRTLQECFSEYNLIFVIGVLSDKDIRNIVKELLCDNNSISEIIITQPQSERAFSTEAIKKEVSAYTSSITIRLTVSSALKYARQIALTANTKGTKTLICVTGSLYTIADAMDCK